MLPGDPAQVLDPAEEPALAQRVGHDIVTSDGTTLLGADDKAGVAEIMTAVAYLHGHARAARHGARRVHGRRGGRPWRRSLRHRGLRRRRRLHARRLRASARSRSESFSARQLKVIIEGNGEHPGTAKGKLVNAVKLAADFVAALPRDGLSPETTEGREGFVHPTRIVGGVEQTIVTLIVRDHDDDAARAAHGARRRLAAEDRGA